MAAEEAAPCRHRGAPPDGVVSMVADIVRAIGDDEAFLASRGLSGAEFRLALPTAIERVRGSAAASNSGRRDYLVMVLDHLRASGAIASYTRPTYGDDTVYRLSVPELGEVAIIQKGCPDGAHSSENWTRPAWADEAYLWWLCSSLKADPGWHVSAGVKRLRRRFFAKPAETLDGIIFHNELCGSDLRPCPKISRAVRVGELDLPPPCIWVMPDAGPGPDYNWNNGTARRFPAVLLSAFNVPLGEVDVFTGNVGFQRQAGSDRTTITSRFGTGRVTSSRS